MRRIAILDTTLRDGERGPGFGMNLEEKLEVARQLARLGVDVIEAGFPITSAGEREAIRKIVALDLKARVCGLARSTKADIDSVLDCGLDYVHTFIATSDIHLKHKLKMTREQVLDKAVETVEYAKSHGLTVEMSCEDGTRTDIGFLRQMHTAVQDAGVDKINLPDTVTITVDTFPSTGIITVDNIPTGVESEGNTVTVVKGRHVFGTTKGGGKSEPKECNQDGAVKFHI